MAIHEKSPLLEAAESLKEYRESYAKREQLKAEQKEKEYKKLEEQVYFGTKEKKRQQMREYAIFSENLKNELLGNAIKSIYIAALSENVALTPNGVDLANGLVDNFIRESNGATSILSKISGKTYTLDYLKAVVEGTYESIMEETDPEKPETTEDVPEEKKEEIYSDLNREEDINKAVEVIAQRITDAEEEFIRKNNEDKKTLQDVASRVAERLKDVENDVTVDEEDKEEIKEESTQYVGRVKSDVRNRPRNVFEQVVINLTHSILTNKELREQYLDENGRLDMGNVIESSKCIYGFLETVNTLQLVRVTPEYIKEALDSM